ncbi:MAG: adenylate/guanylate cyclase domain-containing protein [bacterium]
MTAHAATPNPWADRRLGVVLFLDMVGYSGHMSKNEKTALGRVTELERILRAEVPAFGGRIVKFLGDGTMAEFPTAIAAVSCAQRILAHVREHNAAAHAGERFQVRIGIHLGDVIEKEGDLFGDTVNVAARIQPFADPGGIAMSKTVWLSVRSHVHLKGAGAYLRPRKLKNIPDRIRIYLVPPPGTKRLPWIIKRRYPVKLTGVAVGLLILAAGWLAWDRFAAPLAPTPRIALLCIKPSQTTPVRHTIKKWGNTDKTEVGISPVLFAQKVQDELELRGGTITGLHWVERNTLGDAMKAAGADPAKPETIEPVALKVAQAGTLAHYLMGVLEPKGFDAWRLKLKLVAAKDGAVESSLTVEGNLAPELADAAGVQLRRLAAALTPAAPPGDSPALSPAVSPTMSATGANPPAPVRSKRRKKTR